MSVARKVIKCRIFRPTKKKLELLEKEYQNAQKYLVDKSTKLYSATKQAMDKYVRKIKDGKEYPLFLRNDTFRVEKAKNTKYFDYWVKVPIANHRGGIWLPIKPHQEIEESWKIKDSKIIKKDDYFELHLVVEKEVETKKSSNILAIDLGERVMATVLLDGKPIFYGKEIRGIRRKYAYIRKRLGEKKLLKKIKQIGQKEKRIVNDYLHKISRAIVELATDTNSLIALGDLKGIRKNGKGRKLNRILSNWAYYKLTKYIEYKAKWEGIKVIKIDEKGTSHTCPKCKSEGKRPYQGLFICKSCGYQANADFVGAQNIKRKAEEYISESGVVCEPTQNSEDRLSEKLPAIAGSSSQLLLDKLEEDVLPNPITLFFSLFDHVLKLSPTRLSKLPLIPDKNFL
jgi:putative transposase